MFSNITLFFAVLIGSLHLSRLVLQDIQNLVQEHFSFLRIYPGAQFGRNFTLVKAFVNCLVLSAMFEIRIFIQSKNNRITIKMGNMAAFYEETVLTVKHWNDSLFSFKTTRPDSLRFHNGHFVMLGLMVDGKPLMRAYSIASANYEEELEFLSIKVPNGVLTSRLQHLEEGDSVLISRKPVGTLVVSDLKPGENLFLFATGTGLAPFMSIIQDPETYERFQKVVLVHGVRFASELAYRERIEKELPSHEYLGEEIAEKLIYYPTVTRELFDNNGRITELLTSGKLCDDLGLPAINPDTDRAMICGGPSMLSDICEILDSKGFKASAHTGDVADYVIERAFVEK